MSPSSPRKLAILISALLALGMIVGCGADGDEDAAASDPTASATDSATPTPLPEPPTAEPTTQAVPEILRFSAKTVDGAAFDGSALAGRPTVFWFWAPWCPVCRGQIPQVQDLVEKYGDRVNIVGVGSLDSGGAIKEFADDARGLTHLSDPGGDLWKRFRVAEQSSFLVLDGEGREVLRSGYREKADVDRAIEKAFG